MGQDRAKLKEGGRIWVHLTESHYQGENPIIVNRKGTGGNSPIYPIELKMSIVRWKLLSWKDKPHEGFKCTSAPGQSKSPSVRRTRRDDFDWDSNSDERDRAYMHNVHIRDSDIRAGYAFPRVPRLFHSGVLASKGAEMRVPNIRTIAPSNRENV